MLSAPAVGQSQPRGRGSASGGLGERSADPDAGNPEDGALPEMAWDDEGEGDEVIADPELAQLSEAGADSAYLQSYELHALYHARMAVDFVEDFARDELWEFQQVAQLEAKLRHSERIQFALGLRVRHGIYARSGDTPDGGATRTLFDVLPVAGYLDTSPADGLHLRLGYQMHHLGRFDVLSAINVLSVFDNRSGPTTIPGANEVAQLGARMDWDITPALSVKAVYLPFFMPHIVDQSEGDYALAPPVPGSGADLACSWYGPLLSEFQGMGAPTPVGMSDPVAQCRAVAAQLPALVEGTPARGGRELAARSGAEAFAPAATFLSPQGALRAEWRGADGAAAFTLATALERLPETRYSAPLMAQVTTPLRVASLNVPSPRTEYGRFHVLALDGALTSLGAVQLGAEVSYTVSRALVATTPFELGDVDGDGLSDRVLIPASQDADLAQLGLRAEMIGAQLVLALELFGTVVTSGLPAGRSLLGFEADRFAYGAVGYASYELDEFVFELGVAALNGPTLFLQPRVGYRIADAMEVELGANVMEGPAFSWNNLSAFTLGGYYSHIDQVFIGFRYET